MTTNDYPVKWNWSMKVFLGCYCPHGHVHHVVLAFSFHVRSSHGNYKHLALGSLFDTRPLIMGGTAASFI